MIYKKEAAFSYPIFSNASNSYKNPSFQFEITELLDDNTDYIFKFNYEINSDFIQKLLIDKKAEIVFIILAGDCLFKSIEPEKRSIKVSKTRLSLSSKTEVQLHIKTLETIFFDQCTDELNEFYEPFKSQLIINKNRLLGFSNTEKYQGSENKPLQLLEKRIDPTLKSAFKVELSPSTIVLVFKEDKYQMNTLSSKSSFINMYIYEGLSRALHQFVKDNLRDMETVDIESLQGEQDNELNQKLLDLMINKGIEEINYDNIDEVIAKISNRLIESYVSTMEEIIRSGY